MRLLSSIFALLILTACGDAGSKAETPPNPPKDVFSLRATADIQVPTVMEKAAFLPNPVTPEGASFSLNLPGEIILLSKDGGLWRTTTDGETPKLITEGSFIDVSGVPRHKEHTAFLALESNGQLSAFKKIDDTGKYSRLIVSQSSETVKAICSYGKGVITSKGLLHPLSFVVSDDSVAEIEIDRPLRGLTDISRCDANALEHTVGTSNNKLQWHTYEDGTWVERPALTDFRTTSNLGGDTFIGFLPDMRAPIFSVSGQNSALKVESGLSILGIDNVSFVETSSLPMGSVFSDGLILVGDADSPRLVMISLGYVKRELESDQ